MSSGALDAYMICQALGWEWNFKNMLIISYGPILIIGLFLLILFVTPVILEKWIKYDRRRKRRKRR